MKRNNKFLLIITSLVVLIGGAGCKKYLDVNANLNNPENVPVSGLLTSAERTIGIALSQGSGLTAGLSVYMNQQSTREAPDQYRMTGSNFRIENPWANLYTAIKNLDVVITQGTAEGRLAYVGVAKVLKAYAFSILVDMWGDVPFSEFNRFKEGILQPKFDDDATIYPQLFTMIDAGIADINNTAVNPSKPAADDIIYSGNLTKWIKAANTIKLKMYTQTRKVQNVSTQVNALLASPSTLINRTGEMFVVPFGVLGTSSDDRNPGFSDYTASQRGQNVDPYFYEILVGYPVIFGSTYANPFANIRDPRIPYYWYNQKSATATADNSTEYRDKQFISIIFGSTGPNRNGSQQNSYTLWGIYPVGGRFDDSAGIAIGTSAGQITATAAATGAAPYRLITYADRLYLQAELLNTGVATTGVERTVMDAAIRESFKQVDSVVTGYVKPTQTVPLLMGANGATPTTAVNNYITAVMALFDAASSTKKLEYIMTQKWISSFGASHDQYTDYRRTGFPILFDPRNPTMAPGGQVQPPITGNPAKNPQEKVTVARLNEFPLSLPYPQSELELNASAPPQKPLPIVYKVFWMP